MGGIPRLPLELLKYRMLNNDILNKGTVVKNLGPDRFRGPKVLL